MKEESPDNQPRSGSLPNISMEDMMNMSPEDVDRIIQEQLQKAEGEDNGDSKSSSEPPPEMLEMIEKMRRVKFGPASEPPPELLEKFEKMRRDNAQNSKSSQEPPPEMLELLENMRREDAAIEVHSTEVQEILGYIPNWIIRWGITVILGVILVVTVLSWFVKYPDIIPASIEITSSIPPASLVAQSTGRIKALLTSDNQKVSSGDYLAVIDNNSNYETAVIARNLLFKLSPELIDPIHDSNIDSLSKIGPLLGDLQPAFEAFQTAYRKLSEFDEMQFYGTKLASLQEQLGEEKVYRDQLAERLETLEQDYALSQIEHERKEVMFNSKIITEAEFNVSRSALLGKKYTLQGERAGLTNIDLTITRLGLDIYELRHDSTIVFTQLNESLLNAIEGLKNTISSWERRYVLVAPIDGIVSLTGFWAKDQNVSAGDNVLMVIPDGVTTVIGRVRLPIEGSGKVAPGQQVNIKLTNYPYVEFGMVRGVIETKSLVPDDNYYIVTVSFPNGLITDQMGELNFSQKLSGTAEIITQDSRLLERFFRKTRALLE